MSQEDRFIPRDGIPAVPNASLKRIVEVIGFGKAAD